MRVDRILKVADALDASTQYAPLWFDMGMAANCIAGWAHHIAAHDKDYDRRTLLDANIYNDAMTYMELPWSVADQLFIPSGLDYGTVTAADAALVLRALAERGEVDWQPIIDLQERARS